VTMTTTDVIRIIGNAPSAPEGISSEFTGTYLGLNSAPLAFRDTGVTCHICWVQDWRFFIEKRHLFKAAEQQTRDTVLYHVAGIDTFAVKFKKRVVVPRLGRFGFSADPTCGVFEGYTAAYGALQLALAFKPKRVELYGVDLTYGLTSGRFYQARAGWDLDLHVHGRQIANMRVGIRHLTDAGIEVSVRTPSLITRMIDGQALRVGG